MMMFNTKTKQQGEWVTIEGMEFLQVDGNYINKDNVGTDWVKFDDGTTKTLMDLAEAVRCEDDVNFMLLEHVGDGAQVTGHRISDKMVLEFIMTLMKNFIEGEPIKTVMLMLAIQDTIIEDDE